MPAFTHPEPLISERPRNQRLRTVSVDVFCSSRSKTILEKLWRSKSSASVGSGKELHELISKPNTSKSLCKTTFSLQSGSIITLGSNLIQNCEENCAELDQEVGRKSNWQQIEENCEVGPSKQSQLHEELNRELAMVNQRRKNEAAMAVHCSSSRCEKEGDLRRLITSKSGEINGIRKMQLFTLCELQRVVGKLQFGSIEEQWLAAHEVRKLSKDDPIARVTLAMLGAISPLISMLDSLQPKHQCTALLALLNLAVGNEMNKAAIVKADAVPKMVTLLRSPHREVQEAVVTAFLSLSALDGNKAVIGASGAVAMLVGILSQRGSEQRRKDALRALYNLSILSDNIKMIEEAGGVPLLLAMVEDVEMAEKSLATLSNFAGTDVGRQAITKHKEVAYAVLIDGMRWAEAPKCQERAVYVLMMIAHHSQVQRKVMATAGAISVLIELALLGSPLAQKRASRTLNSFRRAKAFSAPQQRLQFAAELFADDRDGRRDCTRTSSDKKVVDSLVLQSLHRTMRRIVKRANLSTAGILDVDGVPLVPLETLHSLDRRSSSRSLPF